MSPILTTLGLAIVWLVYYVFRTGRREKGLPPGPPTLPLIGNLHQFPSEKATLQFTSWAREFGDIISLKVSSSTIVILSSAQAIKQVVDRTGWNASSRPPNFLAEKTADECHVVFMPTSPRLRTIKKSFVHTLSPLGVVKQIPIQIAETSQLLHDLMTDPDDFYNLIRRYTHSITKSVIYGKRAPFFDSPETLAFFECMDVFEQLLTPGNHPPIDLLPFLKYVPEKWAPWMKVSRSVREKRNGVHYKWLEECEARVAQGIDSPSFIEQTLRHQDEVGITREELSHLGVVLVEGGSDTSGGFLQTLVLALASYPDCQRRAQAEIDAVVGQGRLPSLDDFEKLPYVDAFVKEVMRFRPVFPMTIPHYMLEDVHYNGYVVPKGATVFINTLGVFHDPEVFDKPEIFNPDRFLMNPLGTKPGKDTDYRDSFVFGAGRRLCPGMHIAKQTMYIATMNLLWAFHITPPVDPVTKAPKPINMSMENFKSDLTSCPHPFKCTIRPRSDLHAEMISNALADSTDTLMRYEDYVHEDDKKRLQEIRQSKH